jgi:hypothetical protein
MPAPKPRGNSSSFTTPPPDRWRCMVVRGVRERFAEVEIERGLLTYRSHRARLGALRTVELSASPNSELSPCHMYMLLLPLEYEQERPQ